MTITNVLLTFLIIGTFMALVLNHIKSKKTAEVQETVAVDDQTYTLETMIEYVLKVNIQLRVYNSLHH